MTTAAPGRDRRSLRVRGGDVRQHRPGTSRTGRPWQRLKARIIRRDGGICHLCDQPGADTADHLTPVVHGGAVYDPDNLKAAHVRCNRIRGVRPIDVVRAELIGPERTTSRDW